MRSYEIAAGLTLTAAGLYALRSLEIVTDTDAGDVKLRIFFNPATKILSYLHDGRPRVLAVGGRAIKRDGDRLEEIDLAAAAAEQLI